MEINNKKTDPQMHTKALMLDRLRARIAELEAELETERMRLAACGVAALGYFEGCKDEYYSASLKDVLALKAKYDEARKALEGREG